MQPDVGADAFVLTMILGSVGQITGVEATAHGRSVELDVSLIARRSVDRAGTRHWRRGADNQGAAANLVETEQLVALNGGQVLASYVQVCACVGGWVGACVGVVVCVWVCVWVGVRARWLLSVPSINKHTLILM